jgi:hypothetical protein
MHEDPGPIGIDDAPFAATSELGESLTDSLRARVKAEIAPGERLLWAGQSHPPVVPLDAGTVISAVAVVLLPTLLVGIFVLRALTIEYLRLPMNEAMFGGLVASLLGCALALGKIVGWNKARAERRRKADVCYAVTDRRAIFLIPEPKADAVRVIVVPKGQITDLVRVERSGGFGSLELYIPHFGGRFPWYPFGLQDIPDVRRAEQIIRSNLMYTKKAKREARESTTDSA